LQQLAPEREPGIARALVEFLRRQVRVDDRLDAPARRVCQSQVRAYPVVDPPAERAERRLEESVLVAEIVGDEARRDAGAPRDLRERGADEAELGEAVDRNLDQLPAAIFLGGFARPVAAADRIGRRISAG
jgi:hypothetical protein